MNESIIRRFAKYHGVNLCLRVPFTWISSLAYALQVRGTVESDQETRDRVVAALTRIEDAEMLLARVESFSAPLLASSQEAKAPREFCAFDADRLLAMAGIDPVKWREVKE